MYKTYALMVTIPQREVNLKKVIDTIYEQVDEFRLVLNDYTEIPIWLSSYKKLKTFINTPDKLTSNAIWLAMEDVNGLVFTCDDDILYPFNYVETMKSKMQEYKNKVILTLYGEIAKRPYVQYCMGRYAIGFHHEQEKDRYVDITGVGCSVFHTDSLKPKLTDFPDLYSRDIWFSILAQKNKIPIVRIASMSKWLKFCKTEGSPEITCIWRKSTEYTERRRFVFKNVMWPLLCQNGPRQL